MLIPATALGREFPPVATDVACRATMAYAASLGSLRPAYLDDLRDGNVVAPPPFCVVPEWSVINGPAFRRCLGLDDESAWRGIHVYMDTRFNRMVRPPERLVTSGRITEIRRTSIGTLVTATFVTGSPDEARPVSETWWSSIYVGTECEVSGTLEAPPEVPGSDVSGEIERVPIELSPVLPHIYSECSGIWNPIHTERAIARRSGLPNIIVHGTAIWALVAEALIDAVAEGKPERLRRLSCRFRKPIFPGTAIMLDLSRPSSGPTGHIYFGVSDERQETVLTDGFAEFG